MEGDVRLLDLYSTEEERLLVLLDVQGVDVELFSVVALRIELDRKSVV